jgi:hypothetical protein
MLSVAAWRFFVMNHDSSTRQHCCIVDETHLALEDGSIIDRRRQSLERRPGFRGQAMRNAA